MYDAIFPVEQFLTISIQYNGILGSIYPVQNSWDNLNVGQADLIWQGFPK
jgi:hypothetical protein